MSKSIAKNWAYNVALQIVNLLLPIITVPYVSRALGTDGVGINSFTLATTQYFILIGTLGISMYGNRQIAYCRDNKEKMSRTFWSIYFLNLITTSIALVIYLIIFGTNKTYGYIYVIQSLNIVASIIDITWLYMGLEDFQKTVTRNMIVKIIGVLCIFIFVENRGDLTKYVFINSIMMVLGNAVMWMYLPKTVDKIRVTGKDIVSHLRPTIALFIPQIAIQIYAVLDKTMLGLLADTSQVGVYEQSQKIVKLVLALVTSLGTVMLPRMSNLFAKKDRKKMNEYLNKTLIIISFIAIPMTFGIAGISNEFTWFFGHGFEEVSILMMILSPILFLIAVSNVTGTQYLLPASRNTEFTLSVTAGAVVNVILNFMLISKYKAVGACIATVVAELTVTFIQIVMIRDNIDFRKWLRFVIKFSLGSIIMFIIVRILGSMLNNKVTTTLIQCLVGTIVYFLFMIITKDETTIRLICKIKDILLRKRREDE